MNDFQKHLGAQCDPILREISRLTSPELVLEDRKDSESFLSWDIWK